MNTPTIAQLADMLGLSGDASEEAFASLAAEYAVDARTSRANGDEFSAATARALSDLAKAGAARRREAKANELRRLLEAAAVEVIPVDARVGEIVNRHGFIDVHVYAFGKVHASGSDLDRLAALRACAVALLSQQHPRAGRQYPACDALRKAVES